MKKIIILLLAVVVIWAVAQFSGKILDTFRGIQPVISEPIKLPQTPPAEPPAPGEPVNNNPDNLPLVLPKGFSIKVFARDLINPRVISIDPYGNLVASITSAGKVVALRDTNGDGRSDETVTVANGLNKPHGLAWQCSAALQVVADCKLYIAETNKLSVYDYTKDLKAVNGKKLIDLPTGGNHFTRTLLFRPSPNENELLISIGSTCNVCNESDERRAKILSYDTKTAKVETFASGLRNSVFMNIHPVTGAIWATEMGRDLLGDDIPPDEINIIDGPSATVSGQNSVPNFGWPICYGKNIHDDNFDKNSYSRSPCMEPFEIPSYIDIQAHSAPLGLSFAPEDPPAGGWPEDYWHNLFVAYHGSWNRSVPTGYKVVRYKLDNQGNLIGTEDFITGWIKNNEAWGRPADVLAMPSGLMYISDDKAGLIYRVQHEAAP